MTHKPIITFANRRLRPVRRRPVTASDVRLSILLPLLLLVSWLVPRAFWKSICDRLAGNRKAASDSVTRGIVVSNLTVANASSVGEISRQLRSHRFLSYLQYLCDYRPGGWPCPAALHGADRLRTAQAEGRGVVLWVAHFVYNGLPLKKALHEAGLRVSHLSRPEHGFSVSTYGVKVLNPVRSRIEERYLERRILIKRGAEHVALRQAHRLLSQGMIISITAGHWEGNQVAMVPVGDASLPVSTGAPSLAHATGASLFPVFVGLADDGSFRLAIGDELACDQSLPRMEAVTSALAGFSEQLLLEINRFPGQWRGWKYLEARVGGSVEGEIPN